MKKQLFVFAIAAVSVVCMQAAEQGSVNQQRVFFEDVAATDAQVQTSHVNQAVSANMDFRGLGATATLLNWQGVVARMAQERLDRLARNGQRGEVKEFRGASVEAYKQHKRDMAAVGHVVSRDASGELLVATATVSE